jgi:signal transduction histidine kinase
MTGQPESIESTPELIAHRRMRALHALAQQVGRAETLDACLGLAANALADSAFELPFVLFYVLDDARITARLVAQVGLAPDTLGSPPQIELSGKAVWPLQEAIAFGRPQAVRDVQARFRGLVCMSYSRSITDAYVMPIGPWGSVLAIAARGPRLQADDDDALFVELLAASLSHLVASTLLAEHERTRAAAALEPQTAFFSNEQTGPRARVLLADSNTDMRNELARLLGRSYDVRAVADGEAVLQAALEAPPDILVLDLRLPGKDGLELLKALRGAERTCLIPVILMSSRADEDAALEGLDAGADDYVVKPFSGKVLLARVSRCHALAKLRRESADKLAEANKELEAFSYSVSHDLRAPLRAIDGFSKILLSEYADKLDEQGRRYLERVRAATQRMAELIDDLLSLSRIARAPLARERVDLSNISRRVLGELAAGDPARKVEVQVMEGLTAQGDSRLVAVVLENLLGNAWKFSKQPCARIAVGSELREGQTVFFVRDNGAGFNMDYASRLFTPFQRLHSASDFQGTGIGLATVQRVIARHAGRVWVQAAPNQGATFYFTLAEAA